MPATYQQTDLATAALAPRLHALSELFPATLESARPGPSAAQPRVLLVENDAAMCAMLTDVLSARYEVEAVSDGTAAWEVSAHHPPNLVIIGLYVHGRNSLTLIGSLRADPRTALLPIILLTSSADKALMMRCLEAGASNFLLKPFGMNELLACAQLELDLHGTLRPA